MNDIIKLKDCPICGKKAKVYAFNDGGIAVMCLSCGLRTTIQSDWTVSDCRERSALEKVVELWNNRKDFRGEVEAFDPINYL